MAHQHHAGSASSHHDDQSAHMSTDMADLAGRLAIAMMDRSGLGPVILSQVAEQDREPLEVGLFAAFKSGLFTKVAAEKFDHLPSDDLQTAVTAGRELCRMMETIQRSGNPRAVDFRLQEAKCIAAWRKISEDRVPAVNHLVALAYLGKVMNRPGALTNDEPKATYRNAEKEVFAADIEPAELPRRRTSNLNDSEIARRRAALEAAQKASRS